MFVEVIWFFYVIQSAIAIKPGIITELIQILKSILESVSKQYILTHCFTLTSLNRVHHEHFQKKKNGECSECTVVHRMMNKYYITLTTSMIEKRNQSFFSIIRRIFQ